MEKRTFETRARAGRKKIYGIENADGSVKVLVDCDWFDMCQFRITLAEAELVFADSRTILIQNALPNTHAQLREVFSTGQTPAESDTSLSFKRKMPKSAHKKYPGYEGYPYQE